MDSEKAPTTSSSSVTIGSRSRLTHQNYGVTGETRWENGCDDTNVPGLPPPTSCSKTPFGGHLRDALRDRAAYDGIRSLHLRCEKKPLLTSIISALIPDDEDVRCSSIASISLRCVDVSKLFSRYRFPKLWYLDLSTGVTISSWEDFGLHTTGLTSLSLTIKEPSLAPTTPQLLSILTLNPRLQSLTLTAHMIPRDSVDGSAAPVPLYRLKKLSLSGSFHLVFQLLRRLKHPEMMDEITLFVSGCTVEDVLGTL